MANPYRARICAGSDDNHFQTRQAVADLCRLAERSAPRTLRRLAGGVPVADGHSLLLQLIGEHGCRLDGRSVALHPSLLLAAALPGQDPDAFVAATAILLTDRLQGGAGPDDLYWHWDAFRDLYPGLAPRERVAILQGYREADRSGRVSLSDPPEGAALLSLSTEDVCRLLEPLGNSAAVATLRDALRDGDESGAAAALWARDHAAILVLPDAQRRAILAGLRHLYEAAPDWDPGSGVPVLPPR